MLVQHQSVASSGGPYILIAIRGFSVASSSVCNSLPSSICACSTNVHSHTPSVVFLLPTVLSRLSVPFSIPPSGLQTSASNSAAVHYKGFYLLAYLQY